MIKEGIYDNINIKDYHSDRDYFSSSSLKLAKKSLKLFELWLNGEIDTTGKEVPKIESHFDFGNAFELALLDQTAFENEVFLYDIEARPETNKTMASIKNKEWKEEIFKTDKYIVSKWGEKESFQTIVKMLTSCHKDAVIKKLIQGIEYQYSIFWKDEKTGLKLKTRPDICKTKKNIIVDVKTTIDGSPEKFSKDMADYDYPFQAVMQIDGVIKSGFMKQVDAYYWLVVEKEPPYSATLYEFDPEDIAWVTDEYDYVLNCVSQALKKNHFPSYSYRADNKYGILRANIPLWYKNFGL